MSKFVVYIRLEPFVRQWLEHAFGRPVVFPPHSVENATIRRFITRQPAAGPEPHADEDTAICIPDSKAKPAEYFNHLTLHGRAAVVECIDDTFRRSIWAELNDLSDVGCRLTTAIYTYCENHGIDIDYMGTIRQRYYRMRDGYARKGVSLRKRKTAHDYSDDF